MSISIYCGLTGAGKTYVMTRNAHKLAEKMINGKIEMIPFYANYHISNFPVKVTYFDNPDDLKNIERAIVLIDDGAIWFNSRRWHEFSYDLQYKVINNRKDGLKIFMTTQYFDGIESTIRENCHYYFECEKKFGSDEYAKRPWGLIRVRQYYPRLHDKIRRKPISSKWYWIRKKHTDLYDTYEKIARPPISELEIKKMVRKEKKRARKARDIEARRKKIPIVAI